MPIPLPNLDDRRYVDLVKEIVSLIPRYSPEWTDHNASDPGIMLVELFSWIAEAMMYRLNRIPLSSEETFLKILNGKLSGDESDIAGMNLTDAQAATVLNLRKQWRAITAEDFENLVLTMEDAIHKSVRVKCLPELDFTAADPYTPRTGHVSVILVPDSQDAAPQPSADHLKKVAAYLDERRLITSRVHVVGPDYVNICLQAEVVPVFLENSSELRGLILETLANFFHPLTGGVDQKGWPFGRAVYASEVYQVIEAVTGVDHVKSLRLFKGDAGGFADTGDRIEIGANSLVNFLDNRALNTVRIVNTHE